MSLKDLKVGFAMCGSYCTFESTFEALEKLVSTGCDITPIMSENAYSTDTRFGIRQVHIDRFEQLSKKSIIHTITCLLYTSRCV